MELKPLLAVFHLTERMKPVQNKRLQKNISIACTCRLNTEQKMQSRCKNFCRGGAEKIEIMPVRRKNGFCKDYRFGQDKSPRDTGLDEKNRAAKF